MMLRHCTAWVTITAALTMEFTTLSVTDRVAAQEVQPDGSTGSEPSPVPSTDGQPTGSKGLVVEDALEAADVAFDAEKPPETAIKVRPIRPGVWTAAPTDGEAAKDFAIIGEFVGQRMDDPTQIMGLQIRCLGDGQFEARQTCGGLPGEAAFDESSTKHLIGRRSGDAVVLSGAADAYFVTSDRCTVVSSEAQMIATLQRIERRSPTLGAKPPKGAIVLYRDPTKPPKLSEFMPGATTDGDLLTEGVLIQPLLQDFDLHLEFKIPHMPAMTEQKRGNSGVYLQSRYECQVLDSFGTDRVFNGLGALYRVKPADVNMAFPPLVWQTYDIRFSAARFNADGSKRSKARVSSWVNGVQVQNDVALDGPTGHGSDESPEPLPTKLQNHNDPIRYQNIWMIDRGLTPGVAFPVFQ
ncbi:MAG: DUF1080 domain-containing protein [Planctomycetota bacterium]